MKINIKEIDSSKGDAYCTFKTIEETTGHLILHMVDGIKINMETGDHEILNFHHDYPKVPLTEFNINVTGWFSQFYELEISYEDKWIIIKCIHKNQ